MLNNLRPSVRTNAAIGLSSDRRQFANPQAHVGDVEEKAQEGVDKREQHPEAILAVPRATPGSQPTEEYVPLRVSGHSLGNLRDPTTEANSYRPEMSVRLRMRRLKIGYFKICAANLCLD